MTRWFPSRGRLARFLPRRPVRRGLLAGLLAAALATSAHAVEPVFPQAGSLGLAPPSGMASSKSVAGFEHGSGASIILAEMPPEAWDQIVGRFTPEALAATGFKLKGDRETLPVASGEGFVLRGAPGSGLVTVRVPEKAGKQVPASAVEAALHTIAFQPKASLADQVAALPYAVGDMAGYRPVAVFAGNGLLLGHCPLGPGRAVPDGADAVGRPRVSALPPRRTASAHATPRLPEDAACARPSRS